MENLTKGTKENISDTLHHLLQTKDSLNSRLLAETKQSRDLTIQLSAAENQLRELTENALKTLRKEFEKENKRSTSTVEKLEARLEE